MCGGVWCAIARNGLAVFLRSRLSCEIQWWSRGRIQLIKLSIKICKTIGIQKHKVTKLLQQEIRKKKTVLRWIFGTSRAFMRFSDEGEIGCLGSWSDEIKVGGWIMVTMMITHICDPSSVKDVDICVAIDSCLIYSLSFSFSKSWFQRWVEVLKEFRVAEEITF